MILYMNFHTIWIIKPEIIAAFAISSWEEG